MSTIMDLKKTFRKERHISPVAKATAPAGGWDLCAFGLSNMLGKYFQFSIDFVGKYGQVRM